MSTKLSCSVCKNIFEIKYKNYKFLFEPPFFCSKECLYQYIIQQEYQDSLKDKIFPYVRLAKGTVWSDLHQVSFRSVYEKDVATYLTDKGLDFNYEQYSFFVGRGSYTPDFYIPKHDIFLEVKGPWGFGSKSKLKKFMTRYPDVELIVVPWTMRSQF